MDRRGDLAAELKKLVEGLHPDLRAYFRPSLLGKVVAVHDDDSDPDTYYRVDVVVGADEEAGEEGLSLPSVPCASLFAQEGYSGLLTQLAQVIAEKAAILAAIADEIQALVDAITALIESAGLYVLQVDGGGIASLIENVGSAENIPPWNYESYVAGVCLLAGTADFGPVVELLGG